MSYVPTGSEEEVKIMEFPSPFEVTGVSYLAKEVAEGNVDIVFPYPPEVNGDCYQMEQILPIMA